MRLIKTMLILGLAATMLSCCSGDKEQKKEKGKIEAMTEQTGKEAVKAIKTPMEKAQTAADAASQRAKETDEQNKQ